jgi:hypothetical protein
MRLPESRQFAFRTLCKTYQPLQCDASLVERWQVSAGIGCGEIGFPANCVEIQHAAVEA